MRPQRDEWNKPRRRPTGGPRGGSPRVRPSTAGASPWAEGAAFLTQQLEEEGGWGDGAAPGVEEAVREAAGRAQVRASSYQPPLLACCLSPAEV